MMVRPAPPRTFGLGGHPLVTFNGVAGAQERLLEQEYGHLLTDGDLGEVQVDFEPPPQHPGRRRFSTRGFNLAVDPDGSLLLCDRRGRAGELPVTGTERRLRVDPDLDPRFARAFQQYVGRLVDWRAADAGMVIFKGAAFRVAGRTIGLTGHNGSGKTTALFGSLARAEAYLTNDLIGLAGSATVAGYQAPIHLALGRTYHLPDALHRRIPVRDRAWLAGTRRLVGALPAGARPLVAGRLAGRPVRIDPVRLLPHLELPTSAVLDDLVCLSRHDGDEVIARSIEHEELSAAVAAQVGYYNATQLDLIRVFHGYVSPSDAPWPVMPLDEQVARVPSLLEGVRGWELQVPMATSADEATRILDDLLGSGA